MSGRDQPRALILGNKLEKAFSSSSLFLEVALGTVEGHL